MSYPRTPPGGAVVSTAPTKQKNNNIIDINRRIWHLAISTHPTRGCSGPHCTNQAKINNIIDMIQEFQIRVLPVVASSEQNIISYIADEKGIDARTVNAVRVLKRSIDARQRTIFINLTVRVYINEIPQDAEYVHTEYGDVSQKPQVVVVGEGPGGLFASLRLIELGLRPVVLERGKDVRQRKVDLANGGWLADSWRIVQIFQLSAIYYSSVTTMLR